jgi:hypothetical protein
MQTFYARLSDYYDRIGKVLRGEAEAASVFGHAGDIGHAREAVYLKFLQNHAPKQCDVFMGGKLFGINGEESKQMDVIVTAQSCLQFKFLGPTATKFFTCVDGTLAVASVKSHLGATELHDCLDNLASLPEKSPLQPGQTPPTLNVPTYPDWPFKIIYAPDGIGVQNLLDAISNYYREHQIPPSRWPNLIHVAGKYYIVRYPSESTVAGESVNATTFNASEEQVDAQALFTAVLQIQKRATAASQILFNYSQMSFAMYEHGFKATVPSS